MAPHVAAHQIGIELSARELASWADVGPCTTATHWKVPAVGVPLNEGMLLDIVRYLQWDVVLVVGMRWSDSHALLILSNSIRWLNLVDGYDR